MLCILSSTALSGQKPDPLVDTQTAFKADYQGEVIIKRPKVLTHFHIQVNDFRRPSPHTPASTVHLWQPQRKPKMLCSLNTQRLRLVTRWNQRPLGCCKLQEMLSSILMNVVLQWFKPEVKTALNSESLGLKLALPFKEGIERIDLQ